MIYKTILTGSREYFTDATDYDYIVIRDQVKPFEYKHINNTCYFNYKKMTKEEYLDWLINKNTWWLNFSALLNKEFTDYMNIDIFNDYKIVKSIITKAFKYNYLIPIDNKLNKYFYKMYIYYRYMMNGNYNLSNGELLIANKLRHHMYDKLVLEELYTFFGFEKYITNVIKLLKLPTEEEEILKWFDWYDEQCIQYQRSLRLREVFDKDITKLDEEAKIKSARLKELRNDNKKY